MSEITTTAAPKTETKPEVKAEAKKTVTKKVEAKKTSPAKPSAVSTPGDRKKDLVKVLRKIGAVKAGSAVTFQVAGAKLGITPREAYGLVCGTAGKACSSPTCLAATGHVKIAEHEDGLSIYLTPKGIKTLFDDRPFVRG